VLVLAGAGPAACADAPRNTDMPIPSQQSPLTMQQATERRIAEDMEARVRYIVRAINPRQVPELEGLRLFAVGTGFFITTDRVLTNFHVAGECTALTVGNNTEGEQVVAKLIGGDAAVDLAVLSTKPADVKPARFRTAISAEKANKLAIVGYPEHGLPVLKAELSEVSVPRADLTGAPGRYKFSGGVRRGNSGGPVLDDSGAVVGIVTQKVDTVAVYRATGVVVDDIGIAISSVTIFDFLNANKTAFERATATPEGGLIPGQVLDEARGFVRQIGCWK
jgi:S1-C subfamily serine protease